MNLKILKTDTEEFINTIDLCISYMDQHFPNHNEEFILSKKDDLCKKFTFDIKEEYIDKYLNDKRFKLTLVNFKFSNDFIFNSSEFSINIFSNSSFIRKEKLDTTHEFSFIDSEFIFRDDFNYSILSSENLLNLAKKIYKHNQNQIVQFNINKLPTEIKDVLMFGDFEKEESNTINLNGIKIGTVNNTILSDNFHQILLSIRQELK